MKSQSAQAEKIHNTLKISYDSLDPVEKNIFLDIACFFKGNKMDDVFDVLNKCGYIVDICIATLIDRCLVKIDEYDEDSNVFGMHDLLQEMGRNIVIKESPENPRKRSRLWSSEDINLVFQNNKGSKAIQGVVLKEGWSAPVRHWSAEAFSNMTQLKLLIVGGFAGVLCDFSSLPTSLRVLRWSFYLSKTLPLSDQQYELVEIILKHSKIEYLWHGQKFLRKLKHLDLSNSFQLKQTPDLSEVPNLQTLVLEGCTDLTEVHPSVVHHESLTLLDLTGCIRLEALPGKLEMSSLKELLLDGCLRFENLPEFGKCMTSLSTLSLMSTSIKKLPTSLGCLVGLEHLNLSSSSLTEESFLPDFGHFPSLMDLTGSDELKQTPDLSEVPNLQTLVLEGCTGLTEVHPSVVHHKSLTLLDLTGCKSLKALPGKLEMSSLNELILDDCLYFEHLPEFGECMKSLSRLSLRGTSIKKLPTSLQCLVGLKDLNLSSCSLTEESFPPDFGHFPSLTDLDLSGNDFVSIPISIHELPKLKCLKLNLCSKLRCLPKLPSSVRELEAYDCDSLDIFEFDNLSKVCGVFVSPSQDPSQVLLEMVIDGRKIPSWFVHQQDGNSISIPCDHPRNERSGIALCFQVTVDHNFMGGYLEFALGLCNGNNRFITQRTTDISLEGNYYLYIIFLSKDCFSDGLHQGTCFELSILDSDDQHVKVSSAARWVSKEDMKDLEKSEIERSKKKRKNII